ncbi:MAG: DinB family protein, partial [Chitinophagaceae bacterium]|nr:DinB family protein [Chitinophagaceae bacterium]
LNAYMRFKLGLTEQAPVIKTYEEKEWAKLKDSEVLPANISITLLHALHTRWHELLKSLDREDWNRAVIHPDHNREITLWNLLGMYSWHGRHHIAHITTARENHGWK